MAIITIIGSGMMGSAMSVPARDNGHTVRLVGSPLDGGIIERLKKDGWHNTMNRQLPDGCEYYRIEELDKAMEGADLVISGVNSFGVDWFCDNMLPRIPERTPLLSLTKGLRSDGEGGLLCFPRLFEQRMPAGKKLNIAAIGGPCTSYEQADRNHSCAIYCGEDAELLKKLRGWFETGYYHISLSTDVPGVECAVAIKNCYALGVTLAVGLAEKRRGEGCVLEYNPQAGLFMEAVKEMRRIFALQGISEDNIVWGAGDLYVTVYGGRNRKLGRLLGMGLSFDEAMEKLAGTTLEGVSIARNLVEALEIKASRGEAKLSDFPMIMHIGEIINHSALVDIPWQSFESLL